MVYLGSSNSLTDLKFIFNSHNEFYLYLVGFNVKSTGASSVIDSTNVSNLHIYLSDDNFITGKSSKSLVVAKEITFTGTSGSLKIQGANGNNGNNGNNGTSSQKNGTNGYSGSNGTSALECTALNLLGECTITLQGGNGGNGGKGGNGGNSWLNNNNVGNGGEGGNGGTGGSAGRGIFTTYSKGADGSKGGNGNKGSYVVI